MSVAQAVVRSLRPVALLMATAALLWPVPKATAQIGELAGFGEAMQREYLSRDLVIFAEGLQLDQAQRDILENLFDDYKQDFDQGLRNMQARLENMKDQLQSSGDDQKRILSMIFVPFEEWGEERVKLGENFLSSVQTILNEDQRSRWPAFERRLTREKTLANGVLSGESLNLLLILRDMELSKPVEDQISPVVEEYEVALDRALRERNRVVRRSQTQMTKALPQQDPKAILRLADEQLEQRVNVRNVNDQYARRIAEALPAPHGSRFYQRAMERAYPQAYRPTAGERMYEAASELQNVDVGTQENINALLEVYRAELAALAENAVEAIRRHEPEQKRARVQVYAARLSGEEPLDRKPDPVLATLRTRDELDERFVAILQGLLAYDDFAGLPGAERWLQQQERGRIRSAAKERSELDERARSLKAGTDRSQKVDRSSRGDDGGKSSKLGG